MSNASDETITEEIRKLVVEKNIPMSKALEWTFGDHEITSRDHQNEIQKMVELACKQA